MLLDRVADERTVTTMLPAQWAAHAQAAVVAISARHNVMDSMEKRVRSRFSHRRDIILELAIEDFDHPESGPVALLRSFLSLPVSDPSDNPTVSCGVQL